MTKPLTTSYFILDHDEQEHRFYLASEADAVIRELEVELAALLRGRVHVRIPTETMEQEFATHYRRGFEAGRKQAEAERDAARADAERLDAGCIQFETRDELGQPMNVRYSGVDLRAAIDAARSKE